MTPRLSGHISKFGLVFLMHIDCLQSAFSLKKLSIVLSQRVQRECKPRRYVTIRDQDQTRKDVYRDCLQFAFSLKISVVTFQRKIRDCSFSGNRKTMESSKICNFIRFVYFFLMFFARFFLTSLCKTRPPSPLDCHVEVRAKFQNFNAPQLLSVSFQQSTQPVQIISLFKW